MAVETSIALLFPGQGLLPKDIVTYYYKLRNINPEQVQQRINLAQETINKVHGTATFNISASLEDSNSPNYQDTAFVQPVVYTLSVLATELAQTTGTNTITPRFLAGHSLGEYSALTRAGVIDFEKGIGIVTHRGKFMAEDCQRTPTSLVSINGLTEEVVRRVCNQQGTIIAEIALINAPTLIVIGCLTDLIPEIETLAKEAGAKRTTTLVTAGAFHTHFMENAAIRLDRYLISNYIFRDPQAPIIPNLTGQPSQSGYVLRRYLIEGMVNPVQWAGTLATLVAEGVSTFIEAGPGTSLSTLNKINGISEDQSVNILNWN